jgi:hypothetical protein
MRYQCICSPECDHYVMVDTVNDAKQLTVVRSVRLTVSLMELYQRCGEPELHTAVILSEHDRRAVIAELSAPC